MKEKIGNITLDLTYYPGQDLYSDGEIEDVLLSIAKDNSAEEIKSVIDEKKNWPVLYHFSEQRENIVSWLPIKKTDKVLEVGSGCGAITGAFARKAGEVNCIDLSKKRSMVNAYRHKDADNVTIHVGNFRDIEPHLPADYDYVCLIGVFEYGQSYIASEKPYHEFLEILKKHVKPGGRLVIAIENRLGLKYYAGCKEDHLGNWFSGIEGYPEGGYVRTFSKNGLEKIINECDCGEYHFYYPYPDYKFPTTIFSDKRLPLKGELGNNLRNFDRERLLLFDEKNAFESLVEDGLFPLFSNSHMVIIGPDVNEEFARFSNERSENVAICTTMEVRDGRRVAVKYPLTKAANAHIKSLKYSCERLSEKYAGSDLKICGCEIQEINENEICAVFDFVNGVTLTEILDNYIKAGDEIGFAGVIEEFIKRINYNKEYAFTDTDLVFSNVIVDGDSWTVIDYEWTEENGVDEIYQTWRALYCFVQENGARDCKIVRDTIAKLGITEKMEEEWRDKEIQFHKKVQDSHLSLAQLRHEIGNSIIHPEKYIGANAVSERIERVQIYTDNGSGYSEEKSYFVKNAVFDEGTLTFEISFAGDVKNLRIDPMMGAGVVYIDELLINGNPLPSFSKSVIECNGRRLRGDMMGYVFETDDPNMNIHLEGIKTLDKNVLTAKFTYAYMSERAAHGILTAAKKLI